MRYIIPTLIVMFLLPVTALAQGPPPPPSRWFYGGGLGLSFGDVDYVFISPVIGYRITPRVTTGVGLEYAYRNDNRFGQNESTNDYGGSVFGRFYVAHGVFLAARYEYLRYEYFNFVGDRVSDDYNSVFVGAGIAQPMGRRSEFLLSAMYNLSWSDNEPSPYDSPWVVAAGIGVGF